MSIQLNKLTGLVLLCLAFFSSDLVAQENKFSLSSYGDELSSDPDKFFYFNELEGVLFLNGTIEKGMYTNFRQAITENNIHTIVLNSLGGNVEEGLNIAGTVFDKGIKTYIPIGYECYSACSFIFLAGSEKYAIGELGVHQAAYTDDVSKEKAAIGAVTTVSQLTTADILLRLGEFNTPRFVEQRMLRTAPEDMYVFNAKELNKLGNLDVSNNSKALFKNIDKFIEDLQKYYAKQDCDNDIKKCTSTQLCKRAAANKSWNKATKATKYVTAAKAKGLTCGVPIPVCPENIKKCNKDYLCTYGTIGLDASLSWLNNSFADEAKSRDYSCGVKKQITNRTCSKDIKICTDSQLCKLAVEFGSNPKKWTTDQKFNKYIIEAKSRQLSCGIKKQLVKKTCIKDAKFCNNLMLCQKATDTTTGQGMGWSKLSAFASYVTEAKRRGLSCATYSLSFKEKKCAENLKKCSNFALCEAATYKSGNKILWKTHPAYPQFIDEAQRRLLNCNTKTKPIINLKVELVKSIQLQLNRLGCNAGTADGKIGPKTIKALNKWKQNGGKHPNEKFDNELEIKLNNTKVDCTNKKKVPKEIKGIWLNGSDNCALSLRYNKIYVQKLSDSEYQIESENHNRRETFWPKSLIVRKKDQNPNSIFHGRDGYSRYYMKIDFSKGILKGTRYPIDPIDKVVNALLLGAGSCSLSYKKQ